MPTTALVTNDAGEQCTAYQLGNGLWVHHAHRGPHVVAFRPFALLTGIRWVDYDDGDGSRGGGGGGGGSVVAHRWTHECLQMHDTCSAYERLATR